MAFSQKPRWFPVVSGTEIWGWGHTSLLGLVFIVRNECEEEVLKVYGERDNMSQVSCFWPSN